MTTTIRSIASTARGLPESNPAGIDMIRVIGTSDLRTLDPFVLLDEYDGSGSRDIKGFPEHPHRGCETFTYVLAGRFRHRDNKGHDGCVEAGGGQWTTAGSGLVHREDPEQVDGRAAGFQILMALPSIEKMKPPVVRDVAPGEFPVVALAEGSSVRVMCGRVGEAQGPLDTGTIELVFLDVTVRPGGDATVPVPSGHQAFVYTFDGSLSVGPTGGEQRVARTEVGVLGDGDAVRLRAGEDGGRALVVAGRPTREPILKRGAFVMNTEAEIEQAFLDYKAGRI